MPLLRIIGSGMTVPTAERWGSCFLLQIGGEWLMIDCGPASTYKMHRMGMSCTQINHLFFTHLHSDHLSDYPCFLMTRFDLSLGPEPDLKVYGPPPIKSITHKLWGEKEGAFWHDVVARTQHPMSVGAFERRGGTLPRPEPVVEVQEYSSGKVASGKHWNCYAYEVKHAQPYLQCFGFRFETDEGVIAFSGDTAPTDALVEMAHHADLLVMGVINREEIVQQQPSRVALTGTTSAGKMAEEAGVKRLVINHQSHTINRADLVSQAIYEIKREYSGPVFWGKDMMDVVWE